MKPSEIMFSIRQRIQTIVPFGSSSIIRGNLDEIRIRSIFDFGCGDGTLLQACRKAMKNKRHIYTMGLDIFAPYLRRARARSTHDDYILCDVRRLPLRYKSTDAVLASNVLEHLEKEQGWKLIEEMERVAREKVLIVVPAGFLPQQAFAGNAHEEHKSAWSLLELAQQGYKIRGSGLGVLNRIPAFQSRKVMNYSFIFDDILAIMSGPLLYFFPRFAGSIICTKSIMAKGA